MRTREVIISVFSCLMLAGTSFAEPVLRPAQQAALDTMLASTEPALQPLMREQFVMALSVLDDTQIEVMLSAYASSDTDTEDADAGVSDAIVATPEDLEYNRRQYEPAIRNAWAAGNAFDTFVDSELATNCGPMGSFAVFGSGWRYEVMPLAPGWPRASKSADLDVQIIGASYPPQDGRYRFDFSAMSTEFDKASVGSAIDKACREYRDIGSRFLAVADRATGGEPPPGVEQIERSANAEVQALNLELENALQRWTNSWITPLYIALLNAVPAG